MDHWQALALLSTGAGVARRVARLVDAGVLESDEDACALVCFALEQLACALGELHDDLASEQC